MTTQHIIANRHDIIEESLTRGSWEPIGEETDGLNIHDDALGMTLIYRAENDGDVAVYRSTDYKIHALVADANGPLYVLVPAQ
jgi:hypothetical protein